MNNNFIKRNCPFCNNKRTVRLAEMNVKTLLKSNPGYNNLWFNDSTIPPETVCTFVRCENCFFVFVESVLTPIMLQRYYNESISETVSKAKIFDYEKRQALINHWNILHGHHKSEQQLKVLDFGAGWGDFLAVSKCVGVNVFGLEIDQRKVAFAAKQGINLGNIDYIRENKPYDIFFCNQVLEHLENPRKALLDLRQLISNGAIGFISVPDYREKHLNEELKQIELGKLPTKNFDPLGHLNYFTPETLRNMVQDHGFIEIEQQFHLYRKIFRIFGFSLSHKVAKSVFSSSIYVRAI